MGVFRERIDLDKEKLLELRKKGWTRQQIAEYFGVSKKVVQNNIKRYELQIDRSKTVLDKEKLVELVTNNYSNIEIADFLEVGLNIVKTNLKEYGITRTPEQRQFLKERGNLIKYGVKNPGQAPSVKEKIKDTFRRKYGVDSILSSKKHREQWEEQRLEKYGVKNPIQREEIKAKARATNMEKYGGPAPTCDLNVRKKMADSYEIKTGYRNPSQNPEVQKKKRKTFEERYNVPNSSQQNFSEKAKQVLLSRETLEEYLLKSGFDNVPDMAQDLGVATVTFWRTVRKFNLTDNLPKCCSSGEKQVKAFVESLGVKAKKTKTIFADKREIDIYCPDYNLGIEYNGVYYHSDIFISSRLYHYNKSKDCEERGIRLIHIYEDEWNDPVKQEIIKSLIRIALGKVENKIYARECEIREITNKEARMFNETNHIQGHRNAKVTYGLFYQGKLVQLMSFSRNAHYDAWEIIRGCPGSNNIVVGGVSRLFKHFIREYNPKRIFSYCDFNKFDGKGYEAIGMDLIGETKCNKWYVINDKRYERNPKKYHLYKEMSDAIIWGAGSKKYLWTNPNLSENNPVELNQN